MKRYLLLFWLVVGIFKVTVAVDFEVDPDCEYILQQASRFPPSHTFVTRCCNDLGLRYQCINGYQLVSGNKERICNNSELIGQEPECTFPIVSSCGNPGTIENGFFVGSDFTVSSHVKYHCYEGFKIHGSSHRKCMDNGLWTEKPRCVFKDDAEADLQKATYMVSNYLIKDLHAPHCADSGNPDCQPISRRKRAIDVNHGGGLDIIFMFDGSNSIKKQEFRMGLRFAQELIRILDGTVRRGGLKVAAMSFADNMKINIELTSASVRIMRRIWSIKKLNGCGSNLGRSMFLLRKRISPKLRPDSKRAVFIITNGKLVLGSGHKRASRLLQVENQFSLYVIGIGKNPNKDMLTTLVSQPVKDHYIALRAYNDVFSSVTKAVSSSQEKLKCGISTTKLKSRSIRGNKAASGVWPWQLGIYWDRGRSPICGGALISEQWVITAAHCFFSNGGRKAILWPPWRYTVTVGDHDIRGEANMKQMAPVAKIFIHKDFNYKTHENDIALVKLQYKFKLGKYVRPVCLPEFTGRGRKSAELGKHGFVTEWDRPQDEGIRAIRRKSRSRILVHTALVVSPPHQCKNMTSSPFNVSTMFCAMDKKAYKRDCRGDGGSAFVTESYDHKSRDYRWLVAGVVSWDEKCGTNDHHRYFTRVMPFKKWIDKTTTNNRL